MNIFVVEYESAELCAKSLCDQHVVKMILESAQMLCTTSNLLGQETPYKPCHPKHPCTLWTMSTYENYEWLLSHGRALAKEYTFRYNKRHKTEDVLDWIEKNAARPKNKGLTDFAQCMPEKYKSKDAIQAYRNFYNGEKNFARWNKGRPAPSWYLTNKIN